MGGKGVREPFLPLLPWIPLAAGRAPWGLNWGQGFLGVSLGSLGGS